MVRRGSYRMLTILLVVALLVLVFPRQSWAQGAVGTRPPGDVADAPPVPWSGAFYTSQSITPYVVEMGRLSLSIDAVGTMGSSGDVEVQKPSGASVRAAYLFAATTGFSYMTQGPLSDGDIELEGWPVDWAMTTPSSISSYNHVADVSNIVRAAIGSASAASRVGLTVYESETNRVDGVVLVVIFDDPSQTQDTTIALLFGALDVSGDSFQLTFPEPLDTDDPNLVLEMSLGISFGAQSCASGQYSVVEVNGARLTTSAGGEDDGTCANGALITAGGLDDSPANPMAPYATDNGSARQDDELYDLRSFVADGDTEITVTTNNPSADDNIFLTALRVSSHAAVATGPKRPVVFIPGFMGSELMEGSDEIWPAAQRALDPLYDDSYLEALALTATGSDPDGSTITLGDDIVRNVVGFDYYGGAIEGLEALGYNEGVNLFVFPYDFRKDLSSAATALEQFIRTTVGSQAGNVDIIAHSQGGLVAKQCILRTTCATLVNSAAILGTPFAGTPSGLRVIEYGAPVPEWIIGSGVFVSTNRAKSIAQNWPGLYELIAGPNYYSLFGQGYYVYDRDMDGDGIPEGRLDYATTESFLAQGHNATLVARGKQFQQDDGMADWSKGTNGVNVVVFAGTGLPTLTEIREYERRILWQTFPAQDFTESASGDGTVPVISVALRNANGVDYTSGNVSVFYVDKCDHGDLPRNPVVLQFVANVFANATQRGTTSSMALVESLAESTLPPAPEGILTEPTYVNGRQFVFSGDVDVAVFDEAGGRTGGTEGDAFEENAEGTSYTRIGDTVSIFIYGSGVYTFVVGGRTEGALTVDLRDVTESEDVGETTFAYVPVDGPESGFRLTYDTEVAEPADLLEVDRDGDGVYEASLPPDGAASGQAPEDAAAPVAAIAVSGKASAVGYVGCVQVTLTADDPTPSSGLAKIIYSLGETADVQVYASPLTVCEPGITQVTASAMDVAGNVQSRPTVETFTIAYGLYIPLAFR